MLIGQLERTSIFDKFIEWLAIDLKFLDITAIEAKALSLHLFYSRDISDSVGISPFLQLKEFILQKKHGQEILLFSREN